jgi:hypothetical protein
MKYRQANNDRSRDLIVIYSLERDLFSLSPQSQLEETLWKRLRKSLDILLYNKQVRWNLSYKSTRLV